MAAPNMVLATGVFGRTTFALPGTGEGAVLTNSANSNRLYKITSLYAANIDGAASVDCTIKLYNSATAGTGYHLANTVTIPADATVVMIGKDAPVYLEEDRRVTVAASASGDLSVILSYEEV